MTTTALNEVQSFWLRVFDWIDKLPPLLVPPAQSATPATPVEETDSLEHETLVVVHPGAFTFWLLAKLPVWEEISREEAAQYILQREVRIRYQPLIVEMDRKTILNEIK